MPRFPLLLSLAGLLAPAAHAQITRMQPKPPEAASASASTNKTAKGPKTKKSKKSSSPQLGEHTLGGKSRGGRRGHHALNQ